MKIGIVGAGQIGGTLARRLTALGHDVSGLRCKSWNEFTGPDAPRMDFVITLCDTLEGQDCPDSTLAFASWT